MVTEWCSSLSVELWLLDMRRAWSFIWTSIVVTSKSVSTTDSCSNLVPIMDSNWSVLHEAGNTHANVRCSPRGGGRRLQAVVLVSCVSIDPLSFAGPSVAKHSSEIKF
jgi:hypothetical protein